MNYRIRIWAAQIGEQAVPVADAASEDIKNIASAVGQV